jgi:hypothetical protein
MDNPATTNSILYANPDIDRELIVRAFSGQNIHYLLENVPNMFVVLDEDYILNLMKRRIHFFLSFDTGNYTRDYLLYSVFNTSVINGLKKVILDYQKYQQRLEYDQRGGKHIYPNPEPTREYLEYELQL